jgi:hypothetical protein
MAVPARHSTAPPLAVAVTARLALGRATAATASALTGGPCAGSRCSCVLVARSHTRALPSLLPVMRRVSSTAMQVTGLACPLMVQDSVSRPLHHLAAAALCRHRSLLLLGALMLWAMRALLHKPQHAACERKQQGGLKRNCCLAHQLLQTSSARARALGGSLLRINCMMLSSSSR